jgi:hypothetical protein
LIEGNCDRAVCAIEDFSDGDLGRLRWRLLKRHAGRCGACGAYLKRMEAVLEALAELGRVPAPEDLLDAVMASLVSTATPVEERAGAEVRGRRNLALLALAAGLGLALAVAVAILRWTGGREEGDGLVPAGTA